MISFANESSKKKTIRCADSRPARGLSFYGVIFKEEIPKIQEGQNGEKGDKIPSMKSDFRLSWDLRRQGVTFIISGNILPLRHSLGGILFDIDLLNV